MAEWLAAVASALAFAASLASAGLVRIARAVIQEATQGIEAMLDPALDDLATERAVRRAGLALIVGAGRLAWRIAACLAAAALPVAALVWLGIVSWGSVLDLMLGIEFILAASVALIAAGWIWRRRADAPTERGAGIAESPSERILHRLAFAGPGVQRGLARLDDRALRRRPPPPARPRPIFITSLPRAGTTALLNALAEVPGVATHRYRDMPFLTAPLIWHRVSRLLRRKVTRRERAHGDGLEIDLESPEAFEEVLWLLAWPEKLGPDGIALWSSSDARADATEMFARHMAKIVALRGGPAGRYASKNNANIGRLRLIREMFPGARIVVPLRRPAPHAASLLRQHRNFTALHAAHPFTARYMADIGHFEFGALHRPILFPGFDPHRLTPEAPDYWLAYWVAAFAHIEAHEGLLFVTQDGLRARPREVFGALCTALELGPERPDPTGQFRAGPDETDSTVFDPGLLSEAEALYARIAARAVGAEPRGPDRPEESPPG